MKRYQRGNQKPEIKEQTIQWPNGWRYQRDNQKDRQYNNLSKKDKRTINDVQNTTQKISYNMNPTKSRCFGRVSSSCSTIYTSRVTAKRHKRHVMWKSCYISNTQTYAWQCTKCNLDILYYYYNTRQSGYNLTPIKSPHNPQSIYWRIKVWKIRIHGKIMWSESLLQSSIFNMKVYTVTARELASIVVDCGFVLRSDQTKDYKTSICY